MTSRLKFLTVLIFAAFGLSGCILVDDEVPVYHSYPSGSYEAAIDYYHRPPRHDVSRHRHATVVPPKDNHLDKHNHIKKPEPPKAKKGHEPKKHEHHDIKKLEPKHLNSPEKEKLPKAKIPERRDIREEIKNPKEKHLNPPAKEKMPEPKKPEYHDMKKPESTHHFKHK